jgi:hypothetical protein
VTVTDPSGETFTTNVTYTLTNPAPVAENDGALPVVEDTPTVLNVLGNDVDPDGDALTITEIDGAPVTVGVPTTLPSGAVVTLNMDGTVEYTPVDDYNGPDSFIYTISDGEGGTDVATVNLDVTPVNDVPVVTPTASGEAALPSQSNQDSDTLSLDVSGPFSDIDGDPLMFTAMGLPTGLTIDPVTGVISGTMPAGTSENGPFAVTITATDTDGETVSSEFVWSVGNVAPEVIIPLADITLTDSEDVSIPTASNFSDPDGDDVTYTVTGLPSGLNIDPATGVVSGTVDPTASQSGPYTVTVTATDDQGLSVDNSFTFGVENPAPVAAVDGTLPVIEDTLTVLNVLGNDVDPDGDALTITEINGTPVTVGVPTTLPSGGVVVLNDDGTISYDPASDNNGSDSFTYTISDGEGGTDVATVNLDVTPVNDVPVVIPATPGEPALPAQTNLDGDMITVDTSDPFSDTDGDPLTFTATGLPTGLIIDPVTGVISGILSAGTSADGPYTVTVTATDPTGQNVSTEFVWTVENIAPDVVTALPDVSFNDASDVSLPTAASFVDSDGDALVFTASNLPVGLSIDPITGIISGAVDGSASQGGPYNVTVTATDAQGEFTSVIFTMTVENIAPIVDIGEGLTSGSLSPGAGGNPVVLFSSGVGEPTLIDIGSVSSDPDGDKILTFSVDGELPEGLTLDPVTGVISGTPTVPSAQPYEFTILVEDGEGGQTPVTIFLDVTQDGFIDPDEVSLDQIVSDLDPYEFLEGQPIDLQRYFHDRALDARDDHGRMFGDRDFRGGMVAIDVLGMGGDCAYMFVEAVALEHNVTVSVGSTFPMFCDTSVESWDIRMADGTQLPAWVEWSGGADFMDISRPLDSETLRLQVRAILDNGRTTSTTVEVDLRTGTVTQVGEAYAQGQTLEQQMALETRAMREQVAEVDVAQDALLRALAG